LTQLRLEDRIEQIRNDITSERYTTAAKESASIIEFAFREIFRRSIGVVDGRTRAKALEAERKIGGPGKDIGAFTLGELVRLFRESKLFEAYSEATGTQLRAITMIDFGQVVILRNRMQHDLYEASRGEAQLFLHCVENMLEAFGILTLEAAEEVKPHPGDLRVEGTRSSGKSTRREEQRASSYSARMKNEAQRIGQQGVFHRPLDIRMFDFALHGLEQPVVGLDVGCARGEVTIDRFGAFDQIAKVIGVDRDPECIEQAITSHSGDNRFVFAVLDIEGVPAEDELRRLLAQHAPQGAPVVALLAFVLPHLASPIRTLKLLRSVLPRGSKIVVRTSDDGTKLAYPDLEGRLGYIVETTERAPRHPDQMHGRKLFHQLYRAGFRDIRLFVEPIVLPNLTEEERDLLYDVHFSHRPNWWDEAIKMGDLDSSAQRQVDELKNVLEEYEMDLHDPAYFFFEALFGAVAAVH